MKSNKKRNDAIVYMPVFAIVGFIGGILITIIQNNLELINSGAIIKVLAVPVNVLIIILLVGVVGANGLLLRKTEGLIQDEMDDNQLLQYQKQISLACTISGVTLYGSLALAPVLIGLLIKAEKRSPWFAVTVFIITAACFVISIIQQKRVVALEKKMNPLKQGNFLNFNFRKEWENSCDEAELILMGKASQSAFVAVQYTCLICWLILVLYFMIFEEGILALLVCGLVLVVSTATYGAAEYRLVKGAKNEKGKEED